MKKHLMKSTLMAVAALWSTLGAAQAETLRARVPFEFSVNGTKLPAGEYSISELAGASSVLLVQNLETKAKVMVFARSLGMSTGKQTPLVFVKSAEASAELVAVKAADRTFELSLVKPAPSSLKSAALAISSK